MSFHLLILYAGLVAAGHHDAHLDFRPPKFEQTIKGLIFKNCITENLDYNDAVNKITASSAGT